MKEIKVLKCDYCESIFHINQKEEIKEHERNHTTTKALREFIEEKMYNGIHMDHIIEKILDNKDRLINILKENDTQTKLKEGMS